MLDWHNSHYNRRMILLDQDSFRHRLQISLRTTSAIIIISILYSYPINHIANIILHPLYAKQAEGRDKIVISWRKIKGGTRNSGT